MASHSCCHNKQRINNQVSCSQNRWKRWQNLTGLEVLTGKALSFDLNLLMKLKFSDLRALICGQMRLLLSFAISRFFQKLSTESSEDRLNTFIMLQHFMVFTETVYCRQTSFRLHRQALHRHVILQAKCIFRSQALCLLYLSHPPETGNGRKQSFDNWSDEEEKMFSGIWPYSVLNVSKQRLLTPTN